MEIEIEQSSFQFFGDEYQIKINGKHSHNAFVNYFLYLFWFEGIDLVKAGNDEIILRVEKDSMEIKWNYRIIARNNQEYFLTREDIWGFEYSCKSNKDTYRLYSHNDRKRSIFKNDVQVAWWDKNTYSDYYKIIANNDCNYELLIAICVIIDYISTKYNKSGFSVDYGNPLADLPKFNKNWKPK